MKVVVRNPSLPMLMGWILLGLSVHKDGRRKKWRAGAEAARENEPAGVQPARSPPDVRIEFPYRLRQARRLWQQREGNATAGPLGRV